MNYLVRLDPSKKYKKEREKYTPQRTIWSISVLFVVPLENARCPP